MGKPGCLHLLCLPLRPSHLQNFGLQNERAMLLWRDPSGKK